MLKRNRARRRGSGGPPFVQLHWYLLDSAAWKSLSTAARAAYIELARLYNGTNNGTLALSLRVLAQRLRWLQGHGRAGAKRARGEGLR
jgi:hypothetical protein